MKTTKIILLFGVLLAFFLMLSSGCDEPAPGETRTQQIEQELTEQKQEVYLKTQPPPDLKGFSLERKNLIERTQLWNNENKISYIYLVSYGRVMAFYTIKGKVSSVNSLLTNPERVEWRSGVESMGSAVTSAPAEDGSYGTNGDAVFFFTTDGTYIEWNGEYMLCDKPLKLLQEPLMVMDVTKKFN